MRRTAYAYAAVVFVWNLLRLTPLARWSPFELADLFGWILFLPAPLIAIAALLRQSWRAVAALLLPIAVFSVEYGPEFIPQRVPAGESVRVVTANVYFRNSDTKELARRIAALNADVVTVQELAPLMSRELASHLQPALRYHALYPSDSNGLGIFSRFPLREINPPRMARGSCRCQVVRLQRVDHEMIVINAHPRRPGVGRAFDTSHQVRTVDALLRTPRDLPGAVVLAGDLNIADRDQLFRKIRSDLGDTHRDAGWGLGLTWAHKRRWRVARIDYVLHNEQWQTRSASTVALPGSDHRGVVADLVLRRGG